MKPTPRKSIDDSTTAGRLHKRTLPSLQQPGVCIYKWEVFLYFGVYIVYLFYGLHAIYGVRNRILQIANVQFARGWALLGRPRDNSNDELEIFSAYISSKWCWYVLHAMIMLVLRAWLPKFQCLGHAAVSTISLLLTLKPVSVLLLVGLLATYYTAAQINSKRVLWLLSALWMLLLNFIVKSHYLYSVFDNPLELYTLHVTLYWTVLRCCSFVLNRIAASYSVNVKLYTLPHFLGYTLYFPMLANGPFLEFPRYVAYLEASVSNQLARCLTLAWQLCRVACWWLLMQATLHFLYLHYMSHDVRAVELVAGAFGRHAIGYFLGQFFFLYYVVRYGLGIAFAHFDGMQPPSRPLCIGRIHYYSDMWKHFDEGLYEFLFKHIYSEISRQHSKLLATAATFTFVFVWHGCYEDVFVWSVLNFACLVAEKLFKIGVSSRAYQRWTNKYLGVQWSQRLYALLASQIFIPAAFSNVYFIGGLEVGNRLMRGAYLSGIGNYVALSFCCYCFFQCAEIIANVRSKQPVLMLEKDLVSKKNL